MHEVQGIKDTPELDTRIELSLDAFLPETLVQDERLRVEVYKRIAMIENEDTKMDVEAELIDRFGDIPEPVEALILVAHLRAITRRLGINAPVPAPRRHPYAAGSPSSFPIPWRCSPRQPRLTSASHSATACRLKC